MIRKITTYFLITAIVFTAFLSNATIFTAQAQSDLSEQQMIFFKTDFDDSYFGLYDPFDNSVIRENGNSITTATDDSGNRFMVFEKYSPDYAYSDGQGGSNYEKRLNRVNAAGETKMVFSFDLMPGNITDASKFSVQVSENANNSASYTINGYKIGDETVLSDGIWTTVTSVFDFGYDTSKLTVYADESVVLEKEITINSFWRLRIAVEKAYSAGTYCFDNLYIYSGDPIFNKSELMSLPYASAVNSDNTVIDENIGAISIFGDYILNGVRGKDSSLVKCEADTLLISVEKLASLLDISASNNEYLPYEEAFSLFDLTPIYDARGFVYWQVGSNPDLTDDELWSLYNKLVYERPSKEFLVSNVKKSHPRLVIEDGRIEEIKKQIQSDGNEKWYYESALSYVNEYFNDEPIDCSTDNRSVMYKARDVLNRVQNLSLYYLITGDENYKTRVWQEVEAVIDDKNFPHWQPDSGLDNAEMAAAVAYAYDWLYNDWSTEQKQLLENALCQKALKYAQMHYGAQIDSDHSWWINSKNSNHNAVDNGGYILASLAVIDIYPDIAGNVLERAIRSVESFQNSFYPDGGWKEGTTYWVYAMKYWVPAVTSLKLCYGTDFGMTHSPGMEQSVDFILHSAGLKTNNFHDSGENYVIYSIGSFYSMAKLFGRPDFADIKLTLDKHFPARRSMTALLHLPQNAKVIEADKFPLPKDAMFERIGLVSFREKWLDNEGMFVSFHGGDSLPNHGHWDTGSFVYEYGGVRFAIDLPNEDYSFTDRSLVYRGRAEGHNCLVINPDASSGHQSEAFSPVEAFESETNGAYAVLNMTQAYSPHAESIRRGFKTENNRNSVIIRDEIENLTKDSDIFWFMHITSDTDVQIDGNIAILSKSNAKIKLELKTNLDNSLLVLSSAEPMPTSPNPLGQADNSDYKKITVSGKANLGADVYIQVKLSPVSGDIQPCENIPLDNWQAEPHAYITYNDFQGKRTVRAETGAKDLFSFIALYKDDELTDLITASNNSYDGMTSTCVYNIEDKITAKFFVWEDISTIKPVTVSVSVPDSEN